MNELQAKLARRRSLNGEEDPAAEQPRKSSFFGSSRKSSRFNKTERRDTMFVHAVVKEGLIQRCSRLASCDLQWVAPGVYRVYMTIPGDRKRDLEEERREA